MDSQGYFSNVVFDKIENLTNGGSFGKPSAKKISTYGVTQEPIRDFDKTLEMIIDEKPA